MAHFQGWEYPPPNVYSPEHRDSDGWLRVRGMLLKKGGSRRGSRGGGGDVAASPTEKPAKDLGGVMASVFGRRNWSDRYFELDVERGLWSYYSDTKRSKRCGVVKLIPGRSKIVIPEEVRLRGRHAPASEDDALNYFEVHDTADEDNAARLAPFVVRAPSLREFEEWLRALTFTLKFIVDKRVASSRPVKKAAAPVRRVDTSPVRSPGAAQRADAREEALAAALDEVGVGEGKSPVGDCRVDSAFRRSGSSSKGRPTSESRPERTTASPRASDSKQAQLGFTQQSFLEMEYYYQDMAGAQRGPVDFNGLRAAWEAGAIDALSYVYTNRADEWIEIKALPSLKRLLAPPAPPKAKPAPPAPAPKPKPAAGKKPRSAVAAPKAFRL